MSAPGNAALLRAIYLDILVKWYLSGERNAVEDQGPDGEGERSSPSRSAWVAPAIVVAALAAILGAGATLGAPFIDRALQANPPVTTTQSSATNQPPPSTTLPPSRTAADATVAITSHPDGAEVPNEVVLGGSWSELPGDYILWIFWEAQGEEYYPQDGPIVLQSGGTWSTTLFIDTLEGYSSFKYVIVGVPLSAEQQLQVARATYSSVPRLPEGAFLFDSVDLVRV